MKKLFFILLIITSTLTKGQSDTLWPSSPMSYHNDLQLSFGGGMGFQQNYGITSNIELGIDSKKTGCISRINELSRYKAWVSFNKSKIYKLGFSRNWLFHGKQSRNWNYRIIRKIFVLETGFGLWVNNSETPLLRLSPKLNFSIFNYGWMSINIIPYYNAELLFSEQNRIQNKLGLNLLIQLKR